MKSYIENKKSVKISEILNKKNIISPSRFNKIILKNKNFNLLGNLINISKKSVNVLKNKGYYQYVEIGDINTSTGSVNYKNVRSIDISSPTVFQLEKGDILISTVRTYLGGIGFINKSNPNLVSTKALIILRDLKKSFSRYYLFGVLRSSFFIEQTNLILNASMYPRMEKGELDNIKIPFPTKKNHSNPKKVEQYVSVMIQNIINKEEQIKEKNKLIDEKIVKELKENQKENHFKFNYPKIWEIEKELRLDTGIYEKEFKEFENMIKNYKNGSKNLPELGFDITRGQNLQVSTIGESYYSEEKLNNKFYRLIFSSNISNYATIYGKRYLGNKRKLKTIKKGDIIFCSRGAQFGRVTVFPEDIQNSITNIDNMHISSESYDSNRNIFLAMFLNYFRKIGYLKKIAIFGNGSFSFTQYQFERLYFPNFSGEKQEEIAQVYYLKLDHSKSLNFNNYLEEELKRNKKVGIFQLNSEIIKLRELIEEVIDRIINNKKIKLNFDL